MLDLITHHKTLFHRLCCRDSHWSWSSSFGTHPEQFSLQQLQAIRAARLCTWSIPLMVVIWCGFHTGTAHSRLGLTNVVHAVDFVAGVHQPIFLRRKPRVLEALLMFLFICFHRVRSLLMLSPRYFPQPISSSVCPCRAWDVWWCSWRRSETLMTAFCWMETYLPFPF